MYSTGVQCWCNLLVLLKLASNSGDLLFLPLLIDIVIAWHLRLFLHDAADTCLAQEACDPTGCCVLAEYHELFILLVVCPGHLLPETKHQGNWTFHPNSAACPLVLMFLRMRSCSTQTNYTVLSASGSPRAEVSGFKHLNL